MPKYGDANSQNYFADLLSFYLTLVYELTKVLVTEFRDQ